jgi:hypothetical protein
MMEDSIGKIEMAHRFTILVTVPRALQSAIFDVVI